jgi:hypothetical protein
MKGDKYAKMFGKIATNADYCGKIDIHKIGKENAGSYWNMDNVEGALEFWAWKRESFWVEL